MKRTIEIKGNGVYFNFKYAGYLVEPVREKFFSDGDGFYEVDIEKSIWGKYRMKMSPRQEVLIMFHICAPWSLKSYGLICSDSFSDIFFPLKHRERYNITTKKISPKEEKK